MFGRPSPAGAGTRRRRCAGGRRVRPRSRARAAPIRPSLWPARPRQARRSQAPAPTISPSFRNVRRSILLSSLWFHAVRAPPHRKPDGGVVVSWRRSPALAPARPAPRRAGSAVHPGDARQLRAARRGGDACRRCRAAATPRRRPRSAFSACSARELRVISVVGSRSGRHAGRLRAYSQGDGASFLPSRPFAEGERVTVQRAAAKRPLGPSPGRPLRDRRPRRISSTPETIHAGSPAEVQCFRSRPDLRPPVVTVTAQSPARGAGR